MCDYSLAALPNRLAVEGEELVVHRFRTGSKGLAPPAELQALMERRELAARSFWNWLKGVFETSTSCPNVTAVCVPPGAQLLLKNVPQELQCQWRIEDEEAVQFVQLSAAENTYRDAVELRNGRQVLLQNLREGMLVKVLSLGAVETREEFTLVAQT
jgi:hypothetical protein